MRPSAAAKCAAGGAKATAILANHHVFAAFAAGSETFTYEGKLLLFPFSPFVVPNQKTLVPPRYLVFLNSTSQINRQLSATMRKWLSLECRRLGTPRLPVLEVVTPAGLSKLVSIETSCQSDQCVWLMCRCPSKSILLSTTTLTLLSQIH